MTTTSAKTYDVLIVGGGVIGLSTAWQLAQDGATVCVVDRGELGNEASWAGAGMIPPGPAESHWHAATALEQLAGLSSQLHRQWHERLLAETNIDNQYRRCGSIRLAMTSDQQESLARQVERCGQLGIECARLDRQVLEDLEPELTALDSPAAQAFVLPAEAHIHSRQHLSALAAACRQRGVTLLPHTGIESFRIAEGKISAAISAAHEISAGQYCLAAGCWSGQLAQALEISIDVKPIRGQILLLQGPEGLVRRNIYAGNNYLTPRRDGTILVGSTMEDVGFHKGNTPEALDGLLRFAKSVAPTVADLAIKDSWSGLRPATPDQLPLLGRIPNLENAWIAAGHLRAGLQLSPATAVVMSTLLRGQQPTIDISCLGVERA